MKTIGFRWLLSSISLTFLFFVLKSTFGSKGDESSGVIPPSKCEICKFFALELEEKFRETGKTAEMIETAKGKVKKYKNSELRLVETLDDICERFSTYRLHKQHKDSRRFAKGTSETMQTLQNLVAKGVKVDIGIPNELWDSPPVEVAMLKAGCEQLIEDYEDDIEKWFYTAQNENVPLRQFLCEEKVLKREGVKTDCLYEGDEDIPQKTSKGQNNKGDKEEL